MITEDTLKSLGFKPLVRGDEYMESFRGIVPFAFILSVKNIEIVYYTDKQELYAEEGYREGFTMKVETIEELNFLIKLWSK